MADFSEHLRKLMDARAISAAELARKTKLSEAAISGYLNGKREPRSVQSVSIADALDISLDELWQRSNGAAAIIPVVRDEGMSAAVVPADRSLSDEEYRIILKYRALNSSGQAKAGAYLDDLLGSDANLRDNSARTELEPIGTDRVRSAFVHRPKGRNGKKVSRRRPF